VLEGAPTKSNRTSWGTPEILNVLDQVPKTQQPAARRMLREVMYAPTQAEAERKRQQFEAWAQSRGYRAAAETLGRDWDRMVTLYRYPREHWVHLRTVNVVESPFAALRLRTDAAKRFKRSDRATAVIWKMLMVAERRFRRLNAPHLLAKVYAGVRYVDGVEVTQEVAA
jgi:putative transposase